MGALPDSLVHGRVTDSTPVALFRILTSVHESLRSGNLISKRSIYYQDVELFGSQGIVDNIVDNLAFTLGVGRGDLNIACYNRTSKPTR